MNSDEPKIPEQEQGQQPVVELFDKQEQGQQPVVELFDGQEQPVAEASGDLEALSPTGAVLTSNVTPSDDDDLDFTTPQSEPGPVSQLEKLGEKRAEIALTKPDDHEIVADLTQTLDQLKRQEQELRQKIAALQERESKILSDHLAQTQAAVERMLQEGLIELEQRKQTLQVSVEQLERRRDRIRAEMRTSFAGVSQDLAIRVQGFKDYLVGSLQDLASAAEQLELAPANEPPHPVVEESRAPAPEKSLTPKFAEQGFQEQSRQIRKILDQYRTLPDYYGPPWQLRRTFEPVHAERVSNWLFTQGGRGSIKTMGSRLQNVLIASATISVLRTLYGDRLRTLIIANSPERLGEWRRGLQDCLGISRSDFGPERGIVLFEEASALVQKADRLLTQKQLPLVLIDETEDQINLSLLQFPLWLAFALDPQQVSNYQY